MENVDRFSNLSKSSHSVCIVSSSIANTGGLVKMLFIFSFAPSENWVYTGDEKEWYLHHCISYNIIIAYKKHEIVIIDYG